MITKFVRQKQIDMRKADRVRPYPHFKFPDEIEIGYAEMTDDNCKWHSVAIGSYEMSCINYGWFPTQVLMGTVKGLFSDTNKIGANIGANLGTRSIAVKDIDKAIEMLKAAGYNKIIKK